MPWSETDLFPTLGAYVNARLDEHALIPQDRRGLLLTLSTHVRASIETHGIARLVFICTHNSRRSHLAQIWAQTAAAVRGVRAVETFSGGTEATAFDHRAVAAVQRAGFAVDAGAGENPVYRVRAAATAPSMDCFSKVYDHPANPSAGFVAVMTCSSADARCPVVPGADARLAVTYDDPKAYDGSNQEAAMYDDRCRQIAREMLYAFSLLSAEG